MDHHIKIVSHERDYRVMLMHTRQTLLLIKTDKRPTEKRAERKQKEVFYLNLQNRIYMNTFCRINLYLAFNFDTYSGFLETR